MHSSGSESSRSESVSDDPDSLFGVAERGCNGSSNKLVHLAKSRTGTLPRSTLALMKYQLFPGGPPLGQDESPPIVRKFLQRVLVAQSSIRGWDLRELSTIAQTCDFIVRGKLETSLELLLQRFKRVEVHATSLLPGTVVEHLEIAQVSRNSSLSLCERELSAELDKKRLTCQDKASGRPRHEWGPGQGVELLQPIPQAGCHTRQRREDRQ